MDKFVHRPLTAAFAQAGSAFQPVRCARTEAHSSRPAKILRRCKPLRPVRSFDSGGFAACAQDDKAGTRPAGPAPARLRPTARTGRAPDASRPESATLATSIGGSGDPSTPGASRPPLRMTKLARPVGTPVHRPLTAAFPQVEGAFRPGRRTWKVPHASQPGYAFRRCRPSQPVRSFDFGGLRRLRSG